MGTKALNKQSCSKPAGLFPFCGMCCRPIVDRYLLNIMDLPYHEHCVQCYACGNRLQQTCFVRDAKLYCRIDYDRIFIKKCLSCSERVSPEELVMRAGSNIFHLRCFICVVCGIRLQKGDLYIIKQGQLFCKVDYEKEVEMMQGYGSGELTCEDILQPNRPHDGRRGPKRPRTILTTQQRRAFKASFELSQKPCRKVRENLANDTGLSVRIVQVWFQNQRAKMKKIQKKARQDNKVTGKDLENDDKKFLIKEEQQSPRSGNFNDSSDSETTAGEVDIHSRMEEKHYIKEELENDVPYFKRNLILEDFQGLSTGSGSVDFISANIFNTTKPFTTMSTASQTQYNENQPVNPIDRLYSMQSTYFCAESENSMEV